MSTDMAVYRCDCAWPEVRLDDESGQEFCIKCGGIVDADFSEGDGELDNVTL